MLVTGHPASSDSASVRKGSSPFFLFMILYKSLWLVIVAYPLWSAGELAGSPAEGMANVFVWVVIPIVATPWRYVLDAYILNRARR